MKCIRVGLCITTLEVSKSCLTVNINFVHFIFLKVVDVYGESIERRERERTRRWND